MGKVYRANDLTGQRFGRLMVLYPTGKSDLRKGRLWECQCDCGKTCIVSASLLLEGETRSCGCLKAEQNKHNLRTDYNALHPGENAIKRVMRQGPQRNNTSGIKGVSWHKRSGKWVARIQIRGKIINLGYYKNPEDAAAARKQAEEKLLAESNATDKSTI